LFNVNLILNLFQPEVFWGAEANSTLKWIKDFDTVMDCDMKEGKFEWFKNGKLNAAGFYITTYKFFSPLPV
jgi:hypothetical protein